MGGRLRQDRTSCDLDREANQAVGEVGPDARYQAVGLEPGQGWQQLIQRGPQFEPGEMLA
jgi:hypothetical protein